jgi:hypothetical protein
MQILTIEEQQIDQKEIEAKWDKNRKTRLIRMS